MTVDAQAPSSRLRPARLAAAASVRQRRWKGVRHSGMGTLVLRCSGARSHADRGARGQPGQLKLAVLHAVDAPAFGQGLADGQHFRALRAGEKNAGLSVLHQLAQPLVGEGRRRRWRRHFVWRGQGARRWRRWWWGRHPRRLFSRPQGWPRITVRLHGRAGCRRHGQGRSGWLAAIGNSRRPGRLWQALRPRADSGWQRGVIGQPGRPDGGNNRGRCGPTQGGSHRGPRCAVATSDTCTGLRCENVHSRSKSSSGMAASARRRLMRSSTSAASAVSAPPTRVRKAG